MRRKRPRQACTSQADGMDAGSSVALGLCLRHGDYRLHPAPQSATLPLVSAHTQQLLDRLPREVMATECSRSAAAAFQPLLKGSTFRLQCALQDSVGTISVYTKQLADRLHRVQLVSGAASAAAQEEMAGLRSTVFRLQRPQHRLQCVCDSAGMQASTGRLPTPLLDCGKWTDFLRRSSCANLRGQCLEPIPRKVFANICRPSRSLGRTLERLQRQIQPVLCWTRCDDRFASCATWHCGAAHSAHPELSSPSTSQRSLLLRMQRAYSEVEGASWTNFMHSDASCWLKHGARQLEIGQSRRECHASSGLRRVLERMQHAADCIESTDLQSMHHRDRLQTSQRSARPPSLGWHGRPVGISDGLQRLLTRLQSSLDAVSCSKRRCTAPMWCLQPCWRLRSEQYHLQPTARGTLRGCGQCVNDVIVGLPVGSILHDSADQSRAASMHLRHHEFRLVHSNRLLSTLQTSESLQRILGRLHPERFCGEAGPLLKRAVCAATQTESAVNRDYDAHAKRSDDGAIISGALAVDGANHCAEMLCARQVTQQHRAPVQLRPRG